MAGDYSKNGFSATRRVSTVLMQQGRVTLDSDQNEQNQVLDRRIVNLAQDVWGPAWLPLLTTATAFKLTPIAGPDLTIGTGRLYVSGLAAEVFPGEKPTWQKQPFLPVPQALPAPGPAIAYLDVFEREVTWVEDRDLLEKALYGVDTTTRREVLWQVKLASDPAAFCGMDLDALFPASQGRLTTDATGSPSSDDPCILPPTGGYRGLENRLYRVQVHVAGPPGKAQFKWSRENASVVSPVETIGGGIKSELVVTRIGRDSVLRFAIGDWVEVSDDWRDLLGQAGDMARVENIDETTRTVFLDRAVPAGGSTPFAADAAGHKARHTRLIRWDQSLEKLGNPVDPATGLMTAGTFPIGLEDGVQAGFSAASGSSGAMKVGDHWSFAARTVDGSVERLAAAAPDGIRHFYAPLAVVTVGPGGITFDAECRNPVPPRGDPGQGKPACECCTICVGKDGEVPDLKAALDSLAARAPDPATAVRICLLPGDHTIERGLEVIRPNTRIVGCFPRARLLIGGAGLTFAASLTGIEDVVVVGEAPRGGMVAFVGVGDGFVRGCWFLGQGAAAIAATSSTRLEVEDNRIDGVGIRLLGDCRDVRIQENVVARATGSAIAINGDKSRDITIRLNRLVDATGSGVEVASQMERLLIVDNEIARCRGEENVFDGGEAAGIVVHEAIEDLIIRDNRIENNAADARGEAAGIYVGKGSAIEIARNRVIGNAGTAGDANPMRGGIVITALSAHFDGDANKAHRFDPALILVENVVVAPLGHAVFVVGEGNIRVKDNTLISQLGLARGAGPEDLTARDVASVVLIGTAGLAGIAGALIKAASSGPLAPREVRAVMEKSQSIMQPGRIMLRDNQIGLEQQRSSGQRTPVLSAVAVYGFTDVDLGQNQIDLGTGEAVFCNDVLVFARTTRQQGNRMTESGLPDGPQGALASLLSLGTVQNTCADNQGSHCILPFGLKRIDRDNLVEFPTALCPDA